jgi:hypothetical protein
VAEIAQNATAHWGNLLMPTVTSDAQFSWYHHCAGLNVRTFSGLFEPISYCYRT